MFRKVKISLQTFIKVSGNYHAWPALNFKSQFICNSFGIRTPSEGIWSSFHFHSAPPKKRAKKVVLKRLSHSCKPFVDFSSSFFFLLPHTGRFHGGKWAWKWSEKRPDSSLCLQKSTPPRTLLNPRWAFEATPTSGLILPLQRPGRGWRTASEKARGLAYCADVLPWHEWKQRRMSSNLTPAERFSSSLKKVKKGNKYRYVCILSAVSLQVSGTLRGENSNDFWVSVYSDLHKSFTFPSVGTKIFIFTSHSGIKPPELIAPRVPPPSLQTLGGGGRIDTSHSRYSLSESVLFSRSLRF